MAGIACARTLVRAGQQVTVTEAETARAAEAALPSLEPHYVAQPGMDAVVAAWASHWATA